MALPRVVVTGLGTLTPIGNTLPEFWKNLCGGVSGSAPITHFDASKFKTRFACEVKNLVVTDFIEKREVRRMDPYAQYAIIAADEAVQDANLKDNVDPDRVGVIWAAGIGGLITFHNEVMNFAEGDGTPRFNPFFIPKMIPDIAAGLISMRHNFRGPNLATVSACASSTHAVSMAYDQIRLGKADVMVTGGSEAAVSIPGIGGFNAMKALSERNDSPATASRPFDAERDGFVLGEGGAGLILESLEHAQARGAKIYAELVGTGLTADAHHITAPHPEGLGAKNVMLMALREANMKPSDIDYINVHGTSTPLGDIAEIKAIESVFGESAYDLNISSTKSMTGHLLGAAGAIEAVAVIKSVQEDIVPPTINHFTDDPNIDPKLNLTFNNAQKRTVNAALSNTFGFGGHNASLIVKKF